MFARRKLKNYLFLNKKIQGQFALLLAIVGLFNALYFGGLVFFYTREFFYRLNWYVPDYLLTSDLMKENSRLFWLTLGFIPIGEAIFIALLGLFFSHRIVGPLYAMSLKLKTLARGEVPSQVTLRKNDLLTDFADDLNLALTALTNQRAEIQGALDDLQAGNKDRTIERLKKLTETKQPSENAEPDTSPQPE